MRVVTGFSLILLIKILCLLQNAIANEVIGCGGFIKSHAAIDFSKVEIKLLTKKGALKDKVDCSPSNGYYFLPIYDKGTYLLSISPPPGWSFEPEHVELNFDGKNDMCSQGKDVNFVFKGFGITGKVALAGFPESGAKGVDIELKSENGDDIRRAVTDINGVFSFSPIIPGKYVVRATHPKWHLSKAEHTVVVVSGNTVLPKNSFIVSGFDVSGRFNTDGQLTSGIGVALFKKKGQTLELPSSCNKRPSVNVKSLKTDFETEPACYIEVEKSGEYTFKGVPPGKYLMQPVNENVNLKLHINPESFEFEVGKDTLQLREEFKITGFTVSGKVLNSLNGSPVKSASVILNGKQITKTASDGSYTLESIKDGNYVIQIEAPQLKFDEVQIKLHVSASELPTIVPSSYEVCGKVVSKKSYVVGITKMDSTFHTTATTKAESGIWCTHVPNGKYSIEVLTTEADKNSGIQFYPVQQQTYVESGPIDGIIFSQLRATIRGKVRCLPDATNTCTGTKVTLVALDSNGQPTDNELHTQAQRGKYSFKDVLPGPYEITIPQGNLCYDTTRILLNVASVEVEAPRFSQRGYRLSITSSHRTIIRLYHIAPEGEKSTSESMTLFSGDNTFCVEKFGAYNFKLEGCHTFDESLPKTFVIPEHGQQPALIVNAVAHKVGIRILSTQPDVNTLKLILESEFQGTQVARPTIESHKVERRFAFRHDVYLKPKEVLRISPQSEILLFSPQTKEIVGGNDCVDVAFNFYAIRGLILRGKVDPPIKDTKITLTFPNNPELAAETTLTSITGEFLFAPIDERLSYELKAEKESYVFSDYNHESNSFSADKLCEIVVEVKDESNNPLSGVLLSLSGAESYRKNIITNDDGIIKFHSLSPSQYFLRPMMKEYKFEPNSKIIDIKDGNTEKVTLIGKRFAYSVFGKVSSLNGEPFPNVNIEAVADEKCMHQQEEATSEVNGQYRLRGLQPGCTYTIRLKKPGSNVERTLPSTRSVLVAQEDANDINFIAVSPNKIVDVTARVTATLNEHYKTLRIVMYRRGASDSPIYSQRVPSPLNPKSSFNPGVTVFFPRIPLDGKTYVVELQSSLSDRTYAYKLPVETFVADTGSVFLQLDFKPEVRTAEADISQNSISALILVALVAIAFFRQDLAMDALNFVWSKINVVAADIAQRQKNTAKTNVRKNEPINQREIEQMAEQINAIKKKKTKKI